MDIRLIEFYNNLKNFDFDLFGAYKIDEMEARKVKAALEELREETPKALKVKDVHRIDNTSWLVGTCPKCGLPIGQHHSKDKCSLCGCEIEWE